MSYPQLLALVTAIIHAGQCADNKNVAGQAQHLHDAAIAAKIILQRSGVAPD